MVKDVDGRFVTKSNIVMSVFVFTPRTEPPMTSWRTTTALGHRPRRGHGLRCDLRERHVQPAVRFGHVHPLIEMGTDNRTGVFVQVEVMDLSGECGEEVEVGTCSGVDIPRPGRQRDRAHQRRRYLHHHTDDPPLRQRRGGIRHYHRAHHGASGAYRGDHRFYPGNGTSTVAQLVSAKTFLPSVTMNNGLTTVVEGDTVNIQPLPMRYLLAFLMASAISAATAQTSTGDYHIFRKHAAVGDSGRYVPKVNNSLWSLNANGVLTFLAQSNFANASTPHARGERYHQRGIEHTGVTPGTGGGGSTEVPGREDGTADGGHRRRHMGQHHRHAGQPTVFPPTFAFGSLRIWRTEK